MNQTTEEKEYEFSCLSCSARFFTKYEVMSHICPNRKQKETIYKCDKCPRYFSTSRGLSGHKFVHIRGDFKCSRCRSRFRTKEAQEMHELTHKESKFVCAECKSFFSTSSALEDHSKICEEKQKARKVNNREKLRPPRGMKPPRGNREGRSRESSTRVLNYVTHESESSYEEEVSYSSHSSEDEMVYQAIVVSTTEHPRELQDIGQRVSRTVHTTIESKYRSKRK